MNTHGGKRKNAGRKKGVSEKTLMRRKFQDFFKEREVRELISLIKRRAKQDPTILKFVMEQLFGKAPQRLQLAGDENAPIRVDITEQLKKVYGSG